MDATAEEKRTRARQYRELAAIRYESAKYADRATDRAADRQQAQDYIHAAQQLEAEADALDAGGDCRETRREGQ